VFDYLDIDMRDSDLGWFVGGMSDSPYSPRVKKTTNGGDTWEDASPDMGYTLRAVQFLSDTEGWVCGRFGTVLHTVNGGASWEDRSYPTEATLFDLMFVDGQTGCVVGDSATVIFTNNGGQTWHRRTPGVQEEDRIVTPTRPFSLSFPRNPMKGEVRFSLSGEAPKSLKLYDRKGSCVAVLRPRTGEYVLRRADLKSGIYFVEVESRDYRGVYRFSYLE
jgi:hypothetical protein